MYPVIQKLKILTKFVNFIYNKLRNVFSMNEQNFYESNKALLTDLIAKREELGLDDIQIEIGWGKDYGAGKTSGHMIIVNGREGTSKQDNFEKFREFIKSLANEKIIDEMVCEDGMGSQFPQVENCISISTNEQVSWSHSKGEVCLVTLWKSNKNEPSQDPLVKYQQMLENHPDWNCKVRVSGFCVDMTFDSVKKLVEEKKLDKIEHYQMIEGWDNPLIKKFGVTGMPYVFLLDKNGIVRFNGHPSDMDFESYINKILNNESITESKAEEVGVQELVTIEDYSAIETAILKFIQDYPHEFPNRKYYLSVMLNKKVNKENIDDESFKGAINVNAQHEGHTPDILKQFGTELSNLFANFPKFKVSIKNYFKQRLTPKVGSECSKCDSQLSDDMAKYFCLPCQLDGKDNFTFCTSCIKEDDDSAHEHVLYFLPPGTEDMLDKFTNLRERSKTVSPHPDKILVNYACDNCEQGIHLICWSCAVCCINVSGSFDLCNDCFKLTLDPLKESELKSHVEHDFKKHPMIRIPYNLRAFSNGYIKLD
jgi:hypothetical protein